MKPATLLLLITLTAGGCHTYTEVEATRDGLTLFGAATDDTIRYSHLRLEYGDAFQPAWLELGLELESGEIVALGDIDAAWIAERGEGSPIVNTDASTPGAKVIALGSGRYTFTVAGEHIIEMRTWYGGDRDGVFWDRARQRRYKFPLTSSDATQLFGEPEHVRKRLRWEP